MTKNLNCTAVESKLAELLLDPARVPAKVNTHVAECEACRRELEELKATMGLLDAWEAPEPSPFFMTRMQARMREEREAAPTGWFASRFASFRAELSYGSRLHARPLAAMALTIMLLLGGGAYLDLEIWNQPAQPSRMRPWFTTCRSWTTTRRYWTRWKRCPARIMTTETDSSAVCTQEREER